MDQTEYLHRLFSYDTWANRKILSTLEGLPESSDHYNQMMEQFSHILGAQELWYRRVKGDDLSQLEVWPLYELADCNIKIHNRQNWWNELLRILGDEPNHAVTYYNTSGNRYTTDLKDILHHVVIHGQHHRAQIAKLLRADGITPPPTDFIFYTRESDNNI